MEDLRRGHQQWILDVSRLVWGIVDKGPSSVGGIEGYFSDASRVSWTVKGVMYSCQTLILDAVVVCKAYESPKTSFE